jgi:hypothetical protein
MERPARFRRQARRACDRKRRYKYGVHLPNPRCDAQDVAASLTRIGFETIVGVDLDEAVKIACHHGHSGVVLRVRFFTPNVGACFSIS